MAATVLGLSGFVALLGGPAQTASLPSSVPQASDEQRVINWIRGLQFTDPLQPGSYGALRVHHTAGYAFQGVEYYHVIPYSANLGVRGYLESSASDRFEVAERWIDWYLGHRDMGRTPPGVVLNHWYRADGSGETTCPPGSAATYCNYEDASDSYASTFLWMVDAYLRAAGTRAVAFLSDEVRRAGLADVGEVILFLQDADGLTWARDDYHVKYTMDNSESYAGLAAMASIQAVAFADTAASQRFAAAGQAVRDGIERQLYDASAGRYRLAVHPNGASDAATLLTWYPHTVPVLWPHLMGVVPGSSARAASQMAQVNQAWSGPLRDWTRNQVDATGFLWPSVGHAALLTGDDGRARTHAELVKCKRFPSQGPGNFAWPWSVDDAGWLLSTLAAGVKPTNASGACP